MEEVEEATVVVVAEEEEATGEEVVEVLLAPEDPQVAHEVTLPAETVEEEATEDAVAIVVAVASVEVVEVDEVVNLEGEPMSCVSASSKLT